MKFDKTVAVLGTAALLQFLTGAASYALPGDDIPARTTEQALTQAVKRIQPQQRQNTPQPARIQVQQPARVPGHQTPAAQVTSPPVQSGVKVVLPPPAQRNDENVVTLNLIHQKDKQPVVQTTPQNVETVKKALEARKRSAGIQSSKSNDILSALDKRKAMMARAALSYRGTPYVWGGSSPRAFDCSGFTQYLYRQQYGINLPHNARMQYNMGKGVGLANLQVGDLVFFNTRGPITHVGMYLGNDKFIHAANPRRGVRVDFITSGYYRKVFAGARRYH